jgi:predicted SnoaL-like aldol condensation-catalyzing enzyme
MTPKEMAIEFLNLITQGKIDDAYARFVDMGGKHHNIHVAAGFPELKKAMQDNDAVFPKKQFTIKNVAADGELVAVHSHLVLQAGSLELATCHLLRFSQEKIVELWDLGVPLPETTPNADGAF